jgi:hypothetical protein
MDCIFCRTDRPLLAETKRNELGIREPKLKRSRKGAHPEAWQNGKSSGKEPARPENLVSLSRIYRKGMVPRRGLEPPLLAEHGPEPCASTNSAIWAAPPM